MIWSTEKIQLFNADCFDIFPQIKDKSIDLVLCDLPYGTTQCKWDSVLDLSKLWEQYERIIKNNGAIVLTAQTPFDKVLGASNLKLLKYEWIWEKQKATRFLDCRKRPLQAHENVLVFAKNQPLYNPQMTQGEPYDKGFRRTNADKTQAEIYGTFKGARIINKTGLRFPRTVQKFNTAEGDGKFHPTQKPISLMEFIVKTYTNEGDLVLDNTFGSGTTAVACRNTNRRFVGMEKEKKYFDIAVQRLSEN